MAVGLAGEIEDKGWFFVSDLAGIIRGFTTNLSLLSILAVVLIVVSPFILWRTRLGCGCGRSARPRMPRSHWVSTCSGTSTSP